MLLQEASPCPCPCPCGRDTVGKGVALVLVVGNGVVLVLGVGSARALVDFVVAATVAVVAVSGEKRGCCCGRQTLALVLVLAVGTR